MSSSPPLHRLRPELAELSPYRVPPTPPRIKLDANESPWPLSEEARQAIATAVAELPLNRYPDGRASSLRHALSAHLDASPESLILGAGSDEVIAMMINAFSGRVVSDEPATVLFPGPSFVMYGITSKNHGLRPIDVPLARDGARYVLDTDAMSAAFKRERPSLCFYANPNNPTGEAFDDASLRTLVDAFPETVHVIDEAYGPFHRASPTSVPTTLSSWIADRPQVAVMSTLSKIGLAGVRLGWLQAHPALIFELEKVRQPFNLNAPGQAVAEVLLSSYSELLESQVVRIVEERERLIPALSSLGVVCSPSDANFVLCGLPKSLQAPLLERGIALRFFSDPRLDGSARVTVGTPDETDALVDALRELR